MSNVSVAPSGVSRITAACVRHEDDFRELEKYWNPLLMGSSRPVPFLTYDWASAWWRHIADAERLFILIARRGDAIVGIAPLCIRTARVLGVPVRMIEFLGQRQMSPDHMDFIVTPESRKEAVRALALALARRQDEWDVVSLNGVAQESIVPGTLAQVLAPHQISVLQRVDATCPYIEVPGSWASLMQGFSGRRRAFLRKKRARLESEFDTKFVTVESPADVPAHIRVLAQLHSFSMIRRRQRSPLEEASVGPFQSEVALRMAEQHCFYGARLECNGTPVCANFGFRLNDRYFYYQTGFNTNLSQYSVGTVLLSLTIQDLTERLGIAEFDFLQGQEEYKYDWTQQERKTWSVRCCNRTNAGRLTFALCTTQRSLAVHKERVQQRAGSFVSDFRRRMSCLIP